MEEEGGESNLDSSYGGIACEMIGQWSGQVYGVQVSNCMHAKLSVIYGKLLFPVLLLTLEYANNHNHQWQSGTRDLIELEAMCKETRSAAP